MILDNFKKDYGKMREDIAMNSLRQRETIGWIDALRVLA